MNLSKYDRAGQLQKTFSNKNYGTLTSVDVSNPLRIVLYYRDFNRVIFLDNMLSRIGDDLVLETLGLPTIHAVASSHDNGLWLFTEQNSELIRLNRNLQIENRSGNLAEITGKSSSPDRMLEKGDHLYMHCPGSGILIFDNFGTYWKTIPVVDEVHFQSADNDLVWFNGRTISFINIKTLEKGEYSEPSDSTALDMRIENEAVYVLKKDSVLVYDRPK
jgi:hypothetical protein